MCSDMGIRPVTAVLPTIDTQVGSQDEQHFSPCSKVSVRLELQRYTVLVSALAVLETKAGAFKPFHVIINGK